MNGRLQVLVFTRAQNLHDVIARHNAHLDSSISENSPGKIHLEFTFTPVGKPLVESRSLIVTAPVLWLFVRSGVTRNPQNC